jgi:hypothetical protein
MRRRGAESPGAHSKMIDARCMICSPTEADGRNRAPHGV